MSMAATLTQRILTEHATWSETLGRDAALDARRRHALEALGQSGLPSSRDENWKYANLRWLDRARFAPVEEKNGIAVSFDDLPGVINGYARYTFVDGNFAPELSRPNTQVGISIRSSRNARGGSDIVESHPDARFGLLNAAFGTDGLRIDIAPGTQCSPCAEIVFVATADAQAAASYPRVELRVGSNARFDMIERHINLGASANFVNSAVQIEVEPGAHLEHFRLQQAGAGSNWVDTLLATLAQGAHYQAYLVNLGASSARSTMRIKLGGEHAELRLSAVSVANGHQVHDAYALVEHAASNTRSRQSFRGIAAGRSRSAFNSKVVVREGAHGADSHQSLRGLLAGSDAEIDVRPQLEIHTDDVRCAHGATAGKLDEAMLFYLLSRGIERETAQRILKWAFLEDVVAKIEVPELRRQIEQSLAGNFDEPIPLEELR
jgi:Fe-S cluster assembly protein SufD